MSDYSLEIIVEAGVKRIYKIAGNSLNTINGSALRDGRLQWIDVVT